MKQFKGKAIYNPSGKAGEYSYWACNFYNGCSNGCEYCYCKKGILSGTLGGNVPTLKKCFKSENHALEVFENELKANLNELQRYGLFFSFSTDPMIYPDFENETHEGTIGLTLRALWKCYEHYVPVKILTKRAEWVLDDALFVVDRYKKALTAFGFTLTGHDELEPGASTNQERIDAMKKLHDAGFKTFASIEPIVDFEASLEMVRKTTKFCDLYKIGLMSGKKYDKTETKVFMLSVSNVCQWSDNKIYFKDSMFKQSGYERVSESYHKNWVNRDYNMFN